MTTSHHPPAFFRTAGLLAEPCSMAHQAPWLPSYGGTPHVPPAPQVHLVPGVRRPVPVRPEEPRRRRPPRPRLRPPARRGRRRVGAPGPVPLTPRPPPPGRPPAPHPP